MAEEVLNALVRLLAGFLSVTVVLTLHEFAHAFVAYKCGDPTPKWSGRLTLNPLRHFDLLGLICFAVVGFGWARPVPVNADNFKRYRLGLGLTASAGVIVNYLSAFLFYPLYLVVLFYMPSVVFVRDFLLYLTFFLYARSLGFCVFNLLPLYPLDGFRIVDALDRRKGKFYRFLRSSGQWILLGLIAESLICQVFVDYLGIAVMEYFDILGWFMKFATGILGYPVSSLWGLVPWQ